MNRTIVFAAVAATCGLSLMAAGTNAVKKASKASLREKLAEMTPAEQEAFKSRMAMKRFGGWIVKPGTGAGQIAYVNATKRVDDAFLGKALLDLEDLLQCKFLAQKTDAVITLENVARETVRTKAAAAIFLVESDVMPSLLVAPESDWAIVNVTPLAKDGPDEAKFRMRLEKEIWRAFGFLCGAAYSNSQSCVMNPVEDIEDLDLLRGKYICPEPQVSIRKQLTKIGVKPYYRTTYLAACREGWAPQPTNEFQKAIWEKAHALPKNPMKIEFDPKKGK